MVGHGMMGGGAMGPPPVMLRIMFALIDTDGDGTIELHGLNPNIWLSPLMILGTQWYILFNVIAGASALPTDLKEAASDFHLKGWRWWVKVILPGIFPYYITGAITASGGSWNASRRAPLALLPVQSSAIRPGRRFRELATTGTSGVPVPSAGWRPPASSETSLGGLYLRPQW
jgi:ABC-type glycerol-3-phosphate transport system permease component